jgi:hypothetical protein
MASTIETGHAKNVANFEQLVSFCTGYGATFNPAKATIKLAALTTLLTNVKTAISNVNAAIPAYKNAVTTRETAFEPLNKFVTRIMNALKATDTTQQVDENARTLVRKLQGRRATAKLTDEEKKALADAGKSQKEVSASQLSFDNRLDNFDKLIKLLGSITQYAPNEADLKVIALTTLLTDLKTKNSAVITAITPLSNARIARNDALYKENTGLVDIALDVKSYVKSVYGASSPQYKQISKLEFKRIKG